MLELVLLLAISGGATSQMTWLEDPLPWLKPWLHPA